MSVQHRVQRGWQGAAAIVLIALLAAVAVVLVARDHAGLEAELEARAAAADAVAPVAEALRTEMTAAASGTAAGSKQVALADSSPGDVSSATATRARDTGTTLLEDSGDGVVVAPTYDTRSPPITVEERRKHVTGLRIVPLDLDTTLSALKPSRGGIALAGPNRTVKSLPGAQPSDRATYVVKLRPEAARDWTLTLWTASPPVPMPVWLVALGIVVVGMGAAGWLVRREERSRRSQQELVRLQQASATTAALATVSQHSLELADLLPALMN